VQGYTTPGTRVAGYIRPALLEAYQLYDHDQSPYIVKHSILYLSTRHVLVNSIRAHGCVSVLEELTASNATLEP